MDDLINLPGGGSETLVWVVVLAVLAGLYFLVRRTQRQHYQDYWARRRFQDEHELAEPDDPSQLPTEWRRRDEEPEAPSG